MERQALRRRSEAAPAPAAAEPARPSAATLFVSYSGLLGGGERILVELATHAGRLRPILACPEGELARAARERGLRVFPLRGRRLELRARVRDRAEQPLRLAAQAAEVHELARALRPAVLVGWGARAAVECAAVVRRLDPAPAFVFQNNDLLQGPIITRVARAMARRADLVVSLSATIARALDPDGALDDRSAVVSPGVDLDAYADIPPADGPPHALLLGALVGWKRPRLALEAVALAARELPELTLTIAGPVIDEPGERLAEALRRRAQEPDLLGRVRFAGALNDPRPALAEASCLLHCADCEPYGMVLVEALAAGRPVVAPATCGPAEVVAPDCGRLFVPGDARSAADALVGLFGTPGLAGRIGEAGRRRAERAYRVEDSSRRWAELVEEAASRRRGGVAFSRPDEDRAAGAGLALVTVLHDSEREVTALVESVGRHLPGARIVAIDSGSSDGGPAAVRRLWERATVVELDRNVGFGAACNAAMDLVEEPVTALVNPDVELLDSSLAELAEEVLRGDRPERVLAPLVIHPAGGREDSAHNEPGTPAELARAIVPAGAMPSALRTLVEPWRSDRPRRVGWAVGACLVARTDTLRRLGPFDDGAFMYAEDLDLGLRATDAGVETWFWPSARVLHHRGHAARRVFGAEPFGLLAARRRDVVGRRRGRRRQRVDDGLQLATFANRVAIKTLLGRAADRERLQARALLRARREQRDRSVI